MKYDNVSVSGSKNIRFVLPSIGGYLAGSYGWWFIVRRSALRAFGSLVILLLGLILCTYIWDVGRPAHIIYRASVIGGDAESNGSGAADHYVILADKNTGEIYAIKVSAEEYFGVDTGQPVIVTEDVGSLIGEHLRWHVSLDIGKLGATPNPGG